MSTSEEQIILEKLLHELPQNYRVINASPVKISKKTKKILKSKKAWQNLASFSFVLLVFSLLLINLFSLQKIPAYLKMLLENENNNSLIKELITKSKNREVETELKTKLMQLNDYKFLNKTRETRETRETEIQRLKILADKYPQYPDVYAKLALLFLENKNLDEAKKNIDKALTLDPNRKEFVKITKLINL